MAEPTLSLTLVDFQAELGFNLGYGRGSVAPYMDALWTTIQQANIDTCTKSGMRRFYYPEPLPNEATSYDWSFMKPTASLSFVAGASTITLPDDYGGVDGELTVLAVSPTSSPWLIEWRNESLIRQMYSVIPTSSGPPQYAVVRPQKGTTMTKGQLSELFIFPLADQNYTLQLTYYVNPDYVSTANPYALGGSQHVETILESCLAVAEERLDDQMDGPHHQAFARRLAASVAMDRKNKPQNLGFNRDRSDNLHRPYNRYIPGVATYNGSPFG